MDHDESLNVWSILKTLRKHCRDISCISVMEWLFSASSFAFKSLLCSTSQPRASFDMTAGTVEVDVWKSCGLLLKGGPWEELHYAGPGPPGEPAALFCSPQNNHLHQLLVSSSSPHHITSSPRPVTLHLCYLLHFSLHPLLHLLYLLQHLHLLHFFCVHVFLHLLPNHILFHLHIILHYRAELSLDVSCCHGEVRHLLWLSSVM